MHGDLDNVYATLLHLEKTENTKIDLLLCCGDFQAIRNVEDLESLNVPPKFKSMNSFWKYFSGEAVAPVPTIFIGGNHEASNYMWELYYGGWAAPNIYFLGFTGVVKFGNIQIGGMSGIYNRNHYYRVHYERPPYNENDVVKFGNIQIGGILSGIYNRNHYYRVHYERPPYNENDIRSIYHVREYDVHKLMQERRKARHLRSKGLLLPLTLQRKRARIADKKKS